MVTILGGSLHKYKCNLCFNFADIDNSGYVSDYELQDLFKEASLPLPGYKVREIVEKIIAVTDSNKDGRINFEEFVSVRRSLWMFLCCLISVETVNEVVQPSTILVEITNALGMGKFSVTIYNILYNYFPVFVFHSPINVVHLILAACESTVVSISPTFYFLRNEGMGYIF